MRVVYVVPYKWGGLCHYTMELANAVAEHADVTVITAKGFDTSYTSPKVNIVEAINPLDFSVDKPVKAFSPANLRCLFPSPGIKKALDMVKPDVIHLTTLLAPPLSSSIFFYRLDKKYPMVFTKHGIFSDSSGVIRMLESMLLLSEKMTRFQKMIVHDEKDRGTLISRDSRLESKVSIIPHGIYSLFAEGAGPEVPAEKNCILFFGQIKLYKGLEYLLKAVPMIAAEVPDLKVIIAGEGDMSPYQSLLQCEHLTRLEIYNEFVSNEKSAELFQRSEVVVLPYSMMRSGQSGILHIAYAFSKPVVVTEVGGIPEVVDDGRTGFIVPPQNEKALAEKVIELLKNDDLKKEMSKNIDKIVGELSWDAVARKTLALYEEMLDGGKSR